MWSGKLVKNVDLKLNKRRIHIKPKESGKNNMFNKALTFFY